MCCTPSLSPTHSLAWLAALSLWTRSTSSAILACARLLLTAAEEVLDTFSDSTDGRLAIGSRSLYAVTLDVVC